MYEISLLFLFYSPIIVKTNIVHLVFVAIHEDSQLYLSIKLLTY